MNRQDILARVAAIISDVADLDPSEITLERSLKDELDVDSLGMVEIVVSLEDGFDLRLAEDLVGELVHVSDLVDLVERELAAARAEDAVAS